MRSSSTLFLEGSHSSLGDLPVSLYLDADKTLPMTDGIGAAKEFYMFFSGECFRLAITHIPIALEIEFYNFDGTSKGCLKDLQAGDNGLEWSTQFFYIRVKTLVGLGASKLEIWGFGK